MAAGPAQRRVRRETFRRRAAPAGAGAGVGKPGGGGAQGTQGTVESQAEGEEVEVVDVRWDGRPERVEDEEGNEVKVVKGRDGYVLVLP